MVTLTQTFENAPLENPAQYLKEKLADMDLSSRIKPGQTVAITAGSRGVTDMALAIKTLVAKLKEIKAHPFIFPSMGSHGGATDEGQAEILDALGINEASCGAPIKSSMETVHIGETLHGLPVYVDANAHKADHIIVINRVKPHTDFEGEIESGLTKMMAIGMGKQKGAEICHNATLEKGYYETLTTVVDVILEKAPVTLGVGIVENQLDQTEEIGVAWKEDIPALDRRLLVKAKSVFARLPFDQIDLIIVDEMGKDISGTGMDQNIIARTVIKVGTVPATPKIRRIFVRDLTPASHGTATGLANADFALTRLIDKVDKHATYTNCISSCEPAMAAIPIHFDTDEEVIEAALRTIGSRTPEQARIVHIKNTLHLEIMSVSESMVDEIKENPNLKVKGKAAPLSFDSKGMLILPW